MPNLKLVSREKRVVKFTRNKKGGKILQALRVFKDWMKIERIGIDRIRIKRNKRGGIRLRIRDCSIMHSSCDYCYLYEHSLCSCNPCRELGLLAGEYFIKEK